MADFDRESMLEMFTFEMGQLIEQLEQTVLQSETGYSLDQINEIFRIMHTIKGSAAMMLFDSITTTSHAIEDLFYYIREKNSVNLDYSKLTDIVLTGMDFVKSELGKIESGAKPDGDGTLIIQDIKEFLAEIKGVAKPKAATQTAAPQASAPKAPVENSKIAKYQARIYFEDGCEMENIRAYTLVHNLGETIKNVSHEPADVIDEEAIEVIRKNGFILNFQTDMPFEKVQSILAQTVYLKDLQLEEIKSEDAPVNELPMIEYSALVHLEDVTEMSSVRAFTIVHELEGKFHNMKYEPKDLVDSSASDIINKDGFRLYFSSEKSYEEVRELLTSTSVQIKNLVLGNSIESNTQARQETTQDEAGVATAETYAVEDPVKVAAPVHAKEENENSAGQTKKATQHVINVSVSKLDQLVNLMGELVIAEAMVTQNPELEGLELESFHKETRQLRKIISDLQDTVMSMRMVPLSTTFYKMHRLVRDMCRQLNKDAQLEVVGEETEVDKNIIEHISDPLMHIIRNSVDHGIEMPAIRKSKGKPEKGTVTLEAKNTGGDVHIIIRDDGAGLDKDAIMKKAKNNGLLRKPESEYTEKEIYQFIFLPGFSTNEKVTEYSGRGVGMDVVSTNLEVVSGSVLVESTPGEGSLFTLKIPLTLAIIKGMTIRMGGTKYTIPIVSIKNSFKPDKKTVFQDPNGNEMITVRGEVYNIVRLYEFFNVEGACTNIEEGILIMLENGDQTICLLADELLGEQQVVVKSIPKYIKKIPGISGCTLLGNGDISLLIDIVGFFDK